MAYLYAVCTVLVFVLTVAALRNPYDLPLMPENAALLAAFDYSRDSLAALADVFSGGECRGIMPVAL